jgi:uncharacterized membrane protein
MSPIPPLPNWSGLHPLLTHFPVAMILLSPVSIILGALLDGRWSKRFLMMSLVLLSVGATLMYFAISTGVDAVSVHQLSTEKQSVLDEHRSMARGATSAITLAALLYALTLAIRRWLGVEDNRMVTTILPIAFLVFYSFGVFQLFNAVQHGAQLVHGHAFSDSGSIRGDAQ